MYSCHICGMRIEEVLNFGRQPLANTYPLPGEEDLIWYDAIWAWCSSCEMLQLVDVPDISNVFNASYPYITDQSKFMIDHFAKTAKMLSYGYDLPGKKVLEIGCNSGGMIEHLSGVNVLGVEPASASQTILAGKGIPYWGELFNLPSARTIKRERGTFDLVYSANTLRSIENLDNILRGVLEVLSDFGVLVIEEPYLMDIIRSAEFDQFYSENVYGFTARAIQKLSCKYGLELIGVDALPKNHGGSLRYHIARYGSRARQDISRWTDKEDNVYVACLEMYLHATRIKDKFRQALIKAQQPLVGYGATAKSATILNWAGIGTSLIPVIYDSTPTKIGHVTPGTHIPIVDASEFDNSNAKTVVLFPYNLKQEIIPRENAKKMRNWLLYAPEVHYG
jgi:methylation protein EvaC